MTTESTTAAIKSAIREAKGAIRAINEGKDDIDWSPFAVIRQWPLGTYLGEHGISISPSLSLSFACKTGHSHGILIWLSFVQDRYNQLASRTGQFPQSDTGSIRFPASMDEFIV